MLKNTLKVKTYLHPCRSDHHTRTSCTPSQNLLFAKSFAPVGRHFANIPAWPLHRTVASSASRWCAPFDGSRSIESSALRRLHQTVGSEKHLHTFRNDFLTPKIQLAYRHLNRLYIHIKCAPIQDATLGRPVKTLITLAIIPQPDLWILQLLCVD